ncbi:MAG: ATP-binding protein [Ruminococcaceae bacterium]|nr:ATP-binding protein [Oscillospiraceae bacterium]
MTKINEIYLELCSFAVFDGVLKKPLFRRFFEYAKAKEKDEKLLSYGAFVSEIYRGGASLTSLVKLLTFEDENVYVKAVGNMEKISGEMWNTVEHELDVLSEFASLTKDDFALDMGKDGFLPSFETGESSLKTEYESRLGSIGKYGYGIFASNGMFSVTNEGIIEPIASADRITLDKFVGYKEERRSVMNNTEAFLHGKPAANILLYGDAGTGKSSTVKAVANHFFEEGLRLIEIRKNQLLLLPKVMGEISGNPLKFIIFIDDLSFNQNDDDFSMLKATLEGSASAKAKNAVIYATSNRRHIIKESFSDRGGDDVHRNDTIQETLSLSERFGLTVLFAKPEKKLYLEIIHELAERNGIPVTAELETEAEAFALRRGYRSARCAEQFIESLI